MFYKRIKSSCQTFGPSSAARHGCCVFMGLLRHRTLSFDTVKWRCQGSYQLPSSESVSAWRSGQEGYFCRENFRQRASPTSFRWCSTWGWRKSLRACVHTFDSGEKKIPSKSSKRDCMMVNYCVCVCVCVYTWFSMALVCAADRQKRARASVIGVAGKPTTTTPIFLASISRANALVSDKKTEQQQSVFTYCSTRMTVETKTKYKHKHSVITSFEFKESVMSFLIIIHKTLWQRATAHQQHHKSIKSPTSIVTYRMQNCATTYLTFLTYFSHFYGLITISHFIMRKHLLLCLNYVIISANHANLKRAHN